MPPAGGPAHTLRAASGIRNRRGRLAI